MKYGISFNTLIPVRKTAAEQSEMVTQLLFGETFEVTEREKRFVKVVSSYDGYTGWIDEKMFTEIGKADFDRLDCRDMPRTSASVSDVLCVSDRTKYKLTAGSFLPGYDPDTNRFGAGGRDFEISPAFVLEYPMQTVAEVLETAHGFLNTPYLWGGKSIMGIDCSGFVQVVFSVSGVCLPRDAWQQALEGQDVGYEDVKKGDLMFFSTGDRVTHVGICCGESRIIHASGKVKISHFDAEGIFSDDKTTRTHHLSLIKRIVK
ncbi:MAG: NlpC/P60 family protein [Dysgonomonas sp.]